MEFFIINLIQKFLLFVTNDFLAHSKVFYFFEIINVIVGKKEKTKISKSKSLILQLDTNFFFALNPSYLLDETVRPLINQYRFL